MHTYAVNEIFASLQGEGLWAGTPCIFIRFAGCNLWSGKEERRVADVQRNRASCPRWCDTDFTGSERMNVDEVENQIAKAAKMVRMPDPSFVVITGGEPLLQLDEPLVNRIWCMGARIAVETNGTVENNTADMVDWLTVSPKRCDEETVLRRGDELRLAFPTYRPHDYADLAKGFRHKVLSPVADGSSLSQVNTHEAVRYCLEHPTWRLSVQLHKVIGVR